MARGKGKRANTEGTTIPNDAKAVFAKFYPLIRSAKVDLESKQADAKAANGVYRGALKAYKKAGGDIDTLLEAVDYSKMAPEDADRKIRKLNDHLLWLNVPVGTQLGMFQDGRTVAAHLEDDQIEQSLTDDVRRHKAAQAGYAAGKMPTVIDNPFDGSTDEHGAWQQGFVKAQDELAKQVGEAEVVGATIN